MYALTLTAAALSALALTGAITVESPDRDTIWKSGDSSQTITWKAVSTDPDSFLIQLVNQAGFLTDSPVTLISNQSTGSSDITNSATVTYPNGNWPEGTAFQINFMSSDKSNAAILAQSNQFNITSGGDSSSSTAASSTSSSASSTSTGTSPTTISQASTAAAATTSAASGSASGNIPNASASTSASGSSGAGLTSSPKAAAALFVGAVGLVAALL
ncbi:hypothetical protein I316_04651 [Kwoniella heveanensis BCC8398]|uniref:Yeast cell wall synthesis Kre9/Knh1-like N-terminal domain-containing protein n=1 Tax=Kwoniella heveanensis BCC8398 TaxID=1296120 RepID=A0A1B9GRH9_9TREE|nr:hypothetical protein I316_04651 [Kwoniella heveanensis BCC8398]